MTIKGLHYVARRCKGKPVRWHVYAWRGGPSIHSSEGGPRPLLPPDAINRYQEAMRDRCAVPRDTLAGLATTWRASAAWAGMSPTTRKQWAYVLAEIEAKWGQVPLNVFDDMRVRSKIIGWRDEAAATPRKADYRMQVLSALLGYGRMLGLMRNNFAEGIPGLYKGGQRAEIVWTAAEIEAWQKAPQQVRDAVNLALLTGLRRGDLVGLPLSAIGEHAIVWRTSKSGKRAIISIPMLPDLAALIADLRTRKRADGVATLLVNSFGKSLTPDGFSSSFDDARAALNLPEDKHLHDFRGNYATKLCRAGLRDQEIGRILGWKEGQVSTIRQLYVDEASVVVAIGARLAGRSTVNGG